MISWWWWMRDGREETLVANAVADRTGKRRSAANRVGMLGISAANDPDAVRTLEFGPVAALGQGVSENLFRDRPHCRLSGQARHRTRIGGSALGGRIRIAKVLG